MNTKTTTSRFWMTAALSLLIAAMGYWAFFAHLHTR